MRLYPKGPEVNKYIIDIDVTETMRLAVEADNLDDAISKVYSMPPSHVIREGSFVRIGTDHAQCIEEICRQEAPSQAEVALA